MIPQKLRLSNYCQHRDLTLDFSEHSVIAISAINGGGKSNAFAALKHAIDGQKSAGAQRLADDIFDEAQSAIVDFDFLTSMGEPGRIVRTLNRKGGNSVALKIGKIEEMQSKKALAQFEAMIGVAPSAICDVVIAEQRCIDELLFTSKKRLERFEQFLHGNTFSLPLQAIDEINGRLYIDEHAEQRIAALEQSIRQSKEDLSKVEGQINKLNISLKSAKAEKLLEKAERVSRYTTIKEDYLQRQKDIEEEEAAQTKCVNGLKVYPADLAKQLETKGAKITEVRQAWKQYNRVQQTLQERKRLEERKRNMGVQIIELNKQLQAAQKAKRSFDALSSTLDYLQLQDEKTANIKSIQAKASQLQQEQKQQTELSTRVKEAESVAADAQGTVKLLQDAKQLVDEALSGHDHTSAHCPVCDSDLVAALQKSPVDSRLRAAKEHYAPLKQKAETLRAELNKVNQSITSQQTELRQLRETGAVLDEKMAQLPKPEGEQQDVDTICLQLQQLEPEAKKLPSVEAQLGETRRQLQEVKDEHANLPKLSEEETKLEAPKTSEETLQEWETQQATQQKQRQEQIRLETSLSNHRSNLTRYQSQANALIERAKDEKLPSLNQDFGLSDEEKEYLEQLEVKKKEAANLEIQSVRHSTLIDQYTADIEKTQAATEGAKDTKGCQAFLQELGKRIKQLPHDILRIQLSAICRRMDDIIQDFYLRRPFHLDVNADLNFIMRYNSGVERSIQKASGGERIILGIAFRLAAHQKLAPEMPWLVIDEPTNCLSPENIRVLADVIRYLRGNLGKYNLQKLIFSSHTPVVTSQAEHVITF